MKILKLAAAAALAVAASQASATILAEDDFDYADGSLIGNVPPTGGEWQNHSGTSGDLQVVGGRAVVQHGAPSEDANTRWVNVPGKTYYGIDFEVADLGAPFSGGDNEYFAHFREEGSNNFSARLDIVEPNAGGDFSVGIASDESFADAVWPTDLSFDTVYRAVVEYDQDANIAKLWIDPVDMASPSITGEDRADPGDPVDSFALRQSDSSENETVYVDNLIVATTFSEAVPEPASLALIGMGGLFLARRRKA